MRALRAALVLLAAATLQVALSGPVAIRGASPDLLLLFAVYVALYARPRFGLTFAWMAGAAADMIVGPRLGPFAAAYVLAAYVLIGLRSSLMQGSHVVHVAAAFVCALSCHFAYWAALGALAFAGLVDPQSIGCAAYAARTAIAIAAYSAVVAPPVFWLCGRGMGLRPGDVETEDLRALTAAASRPSAGSIVHRSSGEGF